MAASRETSSEESSFCSIRKARSSIHKEQQLDMLDIRYLVMREIGKSLHQDKRKVTPHKIRALESMLYKSARSLEEYSDIATLKKRLSRIAMIICKNYSRKAIEKKNKVNVDALKSRES